MKEGTDLGRTPLNPGQFGDLYPRLLNGCRRVPPEILRHGLGVCFQRPVGSAEVKALERGDHPVCVSAKVAKGGVFGNRRLAGTLLMGHSLVIPPEDLHAELDARMRVVKAVIMHVQKVRGGHVTCRMASLPSSVPLGDSRSSTASYARDSLGPEEPPL
jgi:hypothetical protein